MIVYHGSTVIVSKPLIIQQDHYFVYGPVADDDVYTTITLYLSGVLTKQQAMEALKIKKLFNQLVITTQKGLGYLHFKGTEEREIND